MMMNDQSMLAEQSVIGSILLDEAAYKEVCGIITEENFILEINRNIYRVCSELYANGGVIDIAVVAKKLEGKVELKYLKELLEITPTWRNAAEYAKIVRDNYKIRRIKEIGLEMYEKTTEHDDPSQIIGNVQQSLEEIEANDTKRDLANSSDMMISFYKHRKSIDDGTDSFVKTGVNELDDILGGGMLNSGLYVLAARPGCGKTTLALQIGDFIVKKGPVLFVSLEMDLDQIAAKRISKECGVPANRLLMANLTDEEKLKMDKISGPLSILPFFVNKAPSATVDDIAFLARKTNGLRAIIIDYFGIIQPVVSNRNRYEDMTIISGKLKALARKMKVPILCLAQLNRENQQRKDKRPMLSDLRETGALEQDADGVIFIHKPETYEDDQDNKSEPEDIEIIVAKNRHAGTGKFDASFYKPISKIVPNYQP